MSTEIQPWNDGKPAEKNKVVPKSSVKIVAAFENEIEKNKSVSTPTSKTMTSHGNETGTNRFEPNNSINQNNDHPSLNSRKGKTRLEPISTNIRREFYEQDIDLQEN